MDTFVYTRFGGSRSFHSTMSIQEAGFIFIDPAHGTEVPDKRMCILYVNKAPQLAQ